MCCTSPFFFEKKGDFFYTFFLFSSFLPSLTFFDHQFYPSVEIPHFPADGITSENGENVFIET